MKTVAAIIFLTLIAIYFMGCGKATETNGSSSLANYNNSQKCAVLNMCPTGYVCVTQYELNGSTVYLDPGVCVCNDQNLCK